MTLLELMNRGCATSNLTIFLEVANKRVEGKGWFPAFAGMTQLRLMKGHFYVRRRSNTKAY